MPIQVSLVTHHFKDEFGSEIPDATFTVRTRLSHNARNKYMNAVSTSVPNLSEHIDPATGKLQEGYRPNIDISILEGMEKVLLEGGLFSLTGVIDQNGKEIRTWEEFLNFDSFYVAQVVKILQAAALAEVKKAGPSPNA